MPLTVRCPVVGNNTKFGLTLLLLSFGAGCSEHGHGFAAAISDVEAAFTQAHFKSSSAASAPDLVVSTKVDAQLSNHGFSTFSSSRLYEAAFSNNTQTQQHKKLWPLDMMDWLTLAVATVAIFVAAGGGIGGGGVLVPLYASLLGEREAFACLLHVIALKAHLQGGSQCHRHRADCLAPAKKHLRASAAASVTLMTSHALLAGFPAKYAVAMSNFTIVGGACANLLFNINRRHSFKPKPLIDWDLILVMEPATILGALIGGYLNKASLPGIHAVSMSKLLCE